MGRLLPVHPVAFCEKAAFPRSVLQRRMQSGDLPTVPIYEDVTTIDPPDHDILIGGFPCQDISSFGLRKGFEGAKSSLYYSILRIVRLKHPKYVFLENVAHILNMPNVWQPVLRTLSAEGYDLKWALFGANSCGAFHRRNRWFILGTRTGTSYAAGEMPDKMHKFGQMIKGVYEEVPDPKIPRTRMEQPIVMKHFPGVECRGVINKTPIKRTLWNTPRASGGTRASCNKTTRSMSDLPSQLRFATCTPPADRHMAGNLKWVETLMGLPEAGLIPTARTLKIFQASEKKSISACCPASRKTTTSAGKRLETCACHKHLYSPTAI